MICSFRQGGDSMLPYNFFIHSHCIYLPILLPFLFKSPVPCYSPLLLSPYPWFLFFFPVFSTPSFIFTLF